MNDLDTTDLSHAELQAVTGGTICYGILVNLGDFAICLGQMIR